MASRCDSAEFTVYVARKRYIVFWSEGQFDCAGRPNTEGWFSNERWEAEPTVENAEAYVKAALANKTSPPEGG